MIYFNWSTSVLLLGVFLFSHRPIKIEAAYISCSLPEAKIITANHNCLWTLNSGPLKIKKMVPMFNSKRKLLSLKWYPDYNWPWGTCSTWNIGHSLQGQQGGAPLRSNNQSGHRNCLFRQVESSQIHNLSQPYIVLVLQCILLWCDVLWQWSKEKGKPG